MEQCVILKAKECSQALSQMIQAFKKGCHAHVLEVTVDDFDTEIDVLKHKKIVLAVDVNLVGTALSFDHFFLKLAACDQPFEGSVGVMLIKSGSDLYTKSLSRHYINLTNKMGLSFIGHGVIEAIEGFENYRTWQKTIDDSLDHICFGLCEKLGERLCSFKAIVFEEPNILVLHASSNKISNTLMLWNKAKMFVHKGIIRELHVENGSVVDCKGCSFKTCVHFSEHKSCFYGGEIVDEILPAIEAADIIVWVCPNYNDSISAKLMAVINRMTVLYRRIEFYKKKIYAVIVSGNSGSDSVEEQLVGSLVINKGFFLPANFSMLAIANDPGSIRKVPNLLVKAKTFGENIK